MQIIGFVRFRRLDRQGENSAGVSQASLALQPKQSCRQALDGPFCSRATGALPNEVASPSSVMPQGGPISVETAGPPQPLRRPKQVDKHSRGRSINRKSFC
jgi:hypothetical protein